MLMKTIAAVALFATLAVGQCTLTFNPTTNNGLNGVAFNVENNAATTTRIDGLDINIDTGTFEVEVWVTSGPADSVLTTQAAWTQVDLISVVGGGVNTFTPLPAFCSPIDIPAGATYGIYFFARTGSPVNYTTGTAAGATSVTDGTLTIFEGWGRSANFGGSPISGRIPSVVVRYVCPGPPPPLSGPTFQTNSDRASLALDGVNGNACSPAITNATIFSCANIQPVTPRLSFRTPNVGLPYEFLLSALPLVPSGQPGSISLPGNQIINVNFFQPLIFINNFFQANVPGFGFPGASGAAIDIDFTLTTAVDFSLQAAVFDPTQLAGAALSQGLEYHLAVAPPQTSVAGPITDTSAVLVDLSNPATCWAPAIPFHGTLYTQFWVSSNGRVTFVGTDTDGGASVAEVATDNPFVGYWCDLNPALGGSITASNPAPGIIRVDYANVPYAGEAATSNSFAIEFDVAAGTVAIDGLLGITANPQTTLSTINDDALLGLTAGNQGGTTAGGPTVFSFGGSGLAANGTDAWFEHYDAVAGGPGIVSSLAAGTLNRLFFVPSGAFGTNYDWFGL